MKKLIYTVICTAAAMLLICAALPAFPVSAETQKATAAVYAAFDAGEEAVPVKITYQQTGIDWEKLNEQARETAAAYAQTLDPALYTADEIAQKTDAYFQKVYNEAYSAELHARASEILTALGIAHEDAVIYALTPYITCKLTQEQLAAAEEHPQIKKIVQAYAWTYSEAPGTETVSDAETVHAMFTKLITENNLDAECVDNTAYAGCPQPVIFEWNVVDGGIPAGMIALDFAEKYHIDKAVYTTVAVIDGVPQITKEANVSAFDRGNVNCKDGTDVSDAVLLARFCAEDAEAVLTEQGKLNADADRDGEITQADVIVILQMIVKLI